MCLVSESRTERLYVRASLSRLDPNLVRCGFYSLLAISPEQRLATVGLERTGIVLLMVDSGLRHGLFVTQWR